MERFVSLDAHREARQHVGAVRPPGDLAEPLGLALSAEPTAGHIEAVQGLVGFRIDLDLGLQSEALGDAGNGQEFGVDGALGIGQQASIQGHRDRL